jgi:ubiquinone/menaquinone biosynthesis C-methylase UbiE
VILSARHHEYFDASGRPSGGNIDLQAWTDQASHWVARAHRTESMTAGATRGLLDRLELRSGERVLDVAAGSGDPALRIAALVGPTGAVTATDAIPEMLAALSSAARAAGLNNLTTQLSTAEALALPPGSHDAACCRFGAMFFSEPLVALHNMRHAVRPGGRLAAMVWGTPGANPYFTVAMEALDAAGVPPLESPPGLKTVFEFSEPRRLLVLAEQAGWQSASEEAVRFAMVIPQTSPDTALDALAQLSRKVEPRLDGLDPAGVARARAALAEGTRPYARGADLSFPAQALLVSGRA